MYSFFTIIFCLYTQSLFNRFWLNMNASFLLLEVPVQAIKHLDVEKFHCFLIVEKSLLALQEGNLIILSEKGDLKDLSEICFSAIFLIREKSQHFSKSEGGYSIFLYETWLLRSRHCLGLHSQGVNTCLFFLRWLWLHISEATSYDQPSTFIMTGLRGSTEMGVLQTIVQYHHKLGTNP